MTRHKLIILTGMTASGKSTLLKHIVSNQHLDGVVSYTTRPMRPGETNGVDYHFISNNEMFDMIKQDKMIEHRTYHTLKDNIADIWYYGTKKKQLTSDAVIIIDLDGAKALINYYGEEQCFVFYIDTPISIIKKRLRGRGDSLFESERRIENDLNVFTTNNLSKIKATYIQNDSTEKMCEEIMKYIVRRK